VRISCQVTQGKFDTRHFEKWNAYRYEHFDSEMPCGFLGLVSVPPNTLQILWDVFMSVEKMHCRKNEECNLLNMVTVMILGSSILKGLYLYP
jgi:hypothetical protein